MTVNLERDKESRNKREKKCFDLECFYFHMQVKATT